MQELYGKISRGECILFLGAGASIGSGAPTGAGLAQYIQEHIVHSDAYYTPDLAKYCEVLLARKLVDRCTLERGIRDRLMHLEPSKGYQALATLPWRAIVSTNFDMLLELEYSKNKERPLFPIHENMDLNSFNIAVEVPFYKIHGSISQVCDPDRPLVLSMSDFKENRARRKRLFDRLGDFLVDTIVFVGYSFSDTVISSLIEEFRESKRWDYFPQKYAVLPSIDPVDEFLLSEQGVQVIKGTFDDFMTDLAKNSDKSWAAKLNVLRISGFGLSAKPIDLTTRDLALANTTFDYYKVDPSSPSDPRSFFKGNKILWADVERGYDVKRKVVDGEGDVRTVNDVVSEITSCTQKRQKKRMMLFAPAGGGKTTYIRRLAYELANKNILCLFLKDGTSMRKGLLAKIYEGNNKEPFVIVVDNAAHFSVDLETVYKECEEHNLPVVAFGATRENEWESMINQGLLKKSLNKVDLVLRLRDRLDDDEVRQLVATLKSMPGLLSGLFERLSHKQLQTKFSQGEGHLLGNLIEAIENHSLQSYVASELDNIQSPLVQSTYGLISLAYQYGIPLRFEHLVHCLEGLGGITWDQFLEEVIRREANSIILQEEYQTALGDMVGHMQVFRARHRVIASIIVQLFYKGSPTKELEGYLGLFAAVDSASIEERNMHHLLDAVVNSFFENKTSLDDVDITHLFDAAIARFSKYKTIQHKKGEFLIKVDRLHEALETFRELHSENERDEYSLHGVAKTNYWIAKRLGNTMERQVFINQARQKFEEGIRSSPQNPYFYNTYLDMVLWQRSEEPDDTVRQDLLDLANSIVSRAKKAGVTTADLSELDLNGDEEVMEFFARVLSDGGFKHRGSRQKRSDNG